MHGIPLFIERKGDSKDHNMKIPRFPFWGNRFSFPDFMALPTDSWYNGIG